ncbi:uncharacterized protein [Watersipora subatra]|uniref:uncharacterized protein n=1 Tax=Watersipora subatra TaxID=2589382 RepID=UPI00355C9E77
MYARAAIIGRVTRERTERRSKILIPAPAKPSPAQLLSSLPVSKSCFIPCTKRPCIALIIASILILIGAVMCNFAYNADHYSTFIKLQATNHTTKVKNVSLYNGLRSLIYVGPTIIGIGAFLIIVGCVLLFDIRDNRLKQDAKLQREQQQRLSRELTNKTILLRQSSRKRKRDSLLSSVSERKDDSNPESPASQSKSIKMVAILTEPNQTCSHEEERRLSQPSMSSDLPKEQINNIATISQPNSPKMLLESKSVLYTEDAHMDKWLPFIRLSSSRLENGPIRVYHSKSGDVNRGYQNSDYDLANTLENETISKVAYLYLPLVQDQAGRPLFGGPCISNQGKEIYLAFPVESCDTPPSGTPFASSSVGHPLPQDGGSLH